MQSLTNRSRNMLYRATFSMLFLAISVSADSKTPPAFIMQRPVGNRHVLPQIIGGRTSILTDFEATLRVTGGAQDCTATLIGPHTVLIAAHCVRDGARGEIILGSVRSPVTCRRFSGYVDGSYDIALCMTEDIVTPLHDAPYERINLDPALPALGDQLLLQGFGCRAVGGVGTKGVLAEGDPIVTKAADQSGEIETLGAAVCSGDSGGAAFARSGTHRMIVGVNARGDLNSVSVLTATATQRLSTFFTQWGGAICGRDPGMLKCHP